MSDLRKAAEMALEALETLMLEKNSIYDRAIKALRQALAQPEQKPVFRIPNAQSPFKPGTTVDAVNMSQERVDETAKREHEPFIYVREDNEKPFGGFEHCSEADAGAFPVYTAPLKREWVGLAKDEIHEMIMGMRTKNMGVIMTEEIFRDVEAKLKEKNT